MRATDRDHHRPRSGPATTRMLAASWLALTLTLAAPQALGWYGGNFPTWQPNPFSVAMLGMLDQMGLLDHYRWYEQELYSGRHGNPAERRRLRSIDGPWLSFDGTVIVFVGGYARVFDRFGQIEDFHVKITGPQLLFKSLYRGSVRGYDVTRRGRYLWLRDDYGNLRIFMRYR